MLDNFPTDLHIRATAYCACSRCEMCGGGSGLLYFFSFSSLWETTEYRLKYFLKRLLNPIRCGVSVLHLVFE